MSGMKVHLTARVDEGLAHFLDRYQQQHHVTSRSEALEDAIRALRDKALEAEYRAAMAEWEATGDADVWDATAGDGLEPDRRESDPRAPGPRASEPRASDPGGSDPGGSGAGGSDAAG